MAAIRSFLRRSLNGCAATPTRIAVAVETLEDRRLLSASIAAGSALDVAPTAAMAASTAKAYGVTLHLQAGQSFNGYMGTLAGAVVNAHTSKVFASINWGDKSPPEQGVVTIGASGNINVGGLHTYSAAGDYSIVVTVSAVPVAVPGQSNSGPARLLGTIGDQAIVAGRSAPGVEIAETANVQFTAKLGSFDIPAPGADLSALIDWGDGTSKATLKATGGAGSGSIGFDVYGTHTYAKPGEYPIRIVVSQSSPVSGLPSRVIETIDSKAVVTSAITGTYKVASGVPDAGAVYRFSGVGVTGNLPLTFTGSVTLPGLVTAGRATGQLTLKTSEGSVVFNVTGPAEKGFGPFPTTLAYVITGSTGNYVGTLGTGVFGITLDMTHQTFAVRIAPA